MLVIGHRGASAACAENTPEAFEMADRMGADGVELDVRLAPDGRGGTRLVVHHDPLPRPQSALDSLPEFDDVLDACGDRMLVNVEIKNRVEEGGFDPTMAMVPPVLDTLRRRGAAWRDRWLVSSFSLVTIAHVRRVAPGVPTAYLVEDLDDEAVDDAVAGDHVAVHPSHVRLTAGDVQAAHTAGLAVNIWTCNDPERLIELRDLGVDGACTDVPDIARTALGLGPEVDLNPRWELSVPPAARD